MQGDRLVAPKLEIQGPADLRDAICPIKSKLYRFAKDNIKLALRSSREFPFE